MLGMLNFYITLKDNHVPTPLIPSPSKNIYVLLYYNNESPIPPIFIFNKHITFIICQGTLIRVFDTITRRQVVELRRGADTAVLYW